MSNGRNAYNSKRYHRLHRKEDSEKEKRKYHERNLKNIYLERTRRYRELARAWKYIARMFKE